MGNIGTTCGIKAMQCSGCTYKRHFLDFFREVPDCSRPLPEVNPHEYPLTSVTTVQRFVSTDGTEHTTRDAALRWNVTENLRTMIHNSPEIKYYYNYTRRGPDKNFVSVSSIIDLIVDKIENINHIVRG